MTRFEERERIEKNLSVIRAYLKTKFPGYALVDVAALGSQKFAVMDKELGKHYKLKVHNERLSQRGSTPTRIEAELERDGVAGHMMQATDCFTW